MCTHTLQITGSLVIVLNALALGFILPLWGVEYHDVDNGGMPQYMLYHQPSKHISIQRPVCFVAGIQEWRPKRVIDKTSPRSSWKQAW